MFVFIGLLGGVLTREAEQLRARGSCSWSLPSLLPSFIFLARLSRLTARNRGLTGAVRVSSLLVLLEDTCHLQG